MLTHQFARVCTVHPPRVRPSKEICSLLKDSLISVTVNTSAAWPDPVRLAHPRHLRGPAWGKHTWTFSGSLLVPTTQPLFTASSKGRVIRQCRVPTFVTSQTYFSDVEARKHPNCFSPERLLLSNHS